MKLAIWDFDGTLAFRDGLWSSALLEVLDRNVPGHGVTREQLAPHLRAGFPWHSPDILHYHLCDSDTWWRHVSEVFATAYSALSLDPNLAAHVREIFCRPDTWSLFPDTIPTLSELQRRGWTHVVLSNHVPELSSISSALGLDALISTIYSSALLGIEKPRAEAFCAVLDDYPDHRTVWMIGDNPDADIRGARAMGIPAVLVRRQTVGIMPYAETLSGVVDVLETGEQIPVTRT